MRRPAVLFLTAVVLSLMLACSRSEDRAGRPPGDVEGADWPVFRGDTAMSGVARDPIPDRLDLLWSFDTGALIVSSPVIGFGKVYIGSTNGGVFALGLGDGRKEWEFMSGDDIEASPLILGDSVFIGNLSGEFFALDAGTGEVRWRVKADNSIDGSANWAHAPDGSGASVCVGC